MDLGNGSGLSAADILALTGNNNDGFGGSGAGMGWWLILLILVLGGGFWGGRGYAGNNGGGGSDMMAAMAMPYMYNTGVQQGFDQSAIMTALNNLNMVVSNGFANAAVDSCNKTMTLMQGQNGIQSDIAQMGFNTINAINNGNNGLAQQMTAYEMARQQCCCDAKLQTANFQATMLAEHCSDRAEIDRAMNVLSTQMNAGFQGVYDRLSQQEIEALKRENENLRTQVNLNNLAASQNAQTQQLIANNQAQTDRIMDFMNPGYARPFYGWPQMQPQCCGNA
jgi:hypothetical protein